MIGLAVVRVPLLALLSTIVCYLSVTAVAHDAASYGLPSPGSFELSISYPDIEGQAPPTSAAGLALIRAALAGFDSSAVLAADADAGVGLGLYDHQHRWPSLPSEITEGTGKTISLRQGSAIASVPPSSVPLLRDHTLLAAYPAGAAPGNTDFVYPLLTATSLSGELVITGPNEQQARTLADSLADLGYDVSLNPVPGFAARVGRSPITYLIVLTLALAWFSATTAWAYREHALRERLLRMVRLGGTRRQVALGMAPLLAGAWLLAAAVGAGTVGVIDFASGAAPIPGGLLGVWAAALGADLVLAVGLGVAQAHRLARQEHE